LRSPHTLDLPLMFANVAASRALVGEGDAPETMATMMSEAWIAFAKTGTPASPLLPRWPAYTLKSRPVMELDLIPQVVNDPDRGLRELSAKR
jgi:para-nitrobenzyl esterase